MKRKLTALLTALILLTIFTTPAHAAMPSEQATAIPTEQSTAIQSFLEEAQRVSGAPGISVAVLIDGETHFFSTGVANRNTSALANEHTIWELASVSKAFTALGLLYLEEQGYLSLTDSIADHLPWFTLRYNGQSVDMREVRLYHFMHSTVGLTNMGHLDVWAQSLEDAVRGYVDAELVFLPGERFEYSSPAYNILGLVMEGVTGQRFEDFMETQIFAPLGLHQTFADRSRAMATGQMARGYMRQFIFMTHLHNPPTYRGIVPTGGMYSSPQDMARWMGIQLGIVEDIPEIFKRLIPVSHETERSVVSTTEGVFYGTYYAAGWLTSENPRRIEHGGNNPGFQAYALLLPEEQIGISILVNLAQTIDITFMANSIADILGGNLETSYQMGELQVMDIIFTIITLVAGALAIVFFILGLRRMKHGARRPITKKRIVLIACWAAFTLAMCALAYAFSYMAMGVDWSFALTLIPVSFLTWLIALALLGASITWFVAFPRRAK